jgi:hypothetical protein
MDKKDIRIAELEQLVREGVQAFDFTRQYVGYASLPCTDDWSWYEWCKRAQNMVDDVMEIRNIPTEESPLLNMNDDKVC